MDNVEFSVVVVVGVILGMFGVQEIIERRAAWRTRKAAAASGQKPR